MKAKRLYFFINGILTKGMDIRGWTHLAEAWIETHTNFHSCRYNYTTDILIFRNLYQAKRVKEVIEVLKRYDGFEIVLVGHSNGCEIITQALKKSKIKIHEIHLFGAATDCDFDKNGLNSALRWDRVEDVYVYGSTRDSALVKAKRHRYLNFLGIGYGWLGLDGPCGIRAGLTNRVHLKWRDSYDHSTWFDSQHFEETMRFIVHAP